MKKRFLAVAVALCTLTCGGIAEAGVKGDVDGNGTVNANDLNLLKRYMSNRSIHINTNNADMNNDGRISTVDLSKVNAKLAFAKNASMSTAYYHPLGNAKYKFSDKTGEGVNHDYSIAAGTPVYAISDGIAYYYQITGNYNEKKNTLVSYGNHVELKSGSVIAKYGHLKRFNGIGLKYRNAQNWGSTWSAVQNYKK